MSLEQLKSDIKTHSFRRLYYFTGNEPYLQRYYYNELLRSIFGNIKDHPDCIIKDGSYFTADELDDAVSSFPIMSEKKAIVLTDLKISDIAANWIANHASEIEDNAIVIIYQLTESIDLKLSNGKNFKKIVTDYGLWVDIGPLDQQTLYMWVGQQFRKFNIKADSQLISYFLSNTSTDMYSLSNEISKLSAYCGGALSKESIDMILCKTIDARTYELTNAIFDKDIKKAFTILKQLDDLRTNEMMILSSVYSYVVTLYKTKLLLISGLTNYEIENELGQKSFIVNKNIKLLNNISIRALDRIITICSEADVSSKTTSCSLSSLLSELIISIIDLL